MYGWAAHTLLGLQWQTLTAVSQQSDFHNQTFVTLPDAVEFILEGIFLEEAYTAQLLKGGLDFWGPS